MWHLRASVPLHSFFNIPFLMHLPCAAPRVKAPGGKLMTKERDGPCAMWFGDGDVTSGEGTDDTDDDDDDDGGFVGGVGFGFVWGPGGMMVGGNTANPGFGPMMHPLMHMMADGVDAMA
jgi:hypothetical protein